MSRSKFEVAGRRIARLPVCSRRAALGQIVAASTLILSPPAVEAADESAISDEVKNAIERGINAILRTQRDDGALVDRAHATAMTSLSIMALASIGVTPEPSTERGRACSRALEFVLLPRNQTVGYFGHHDNSRMYGHGMTTLMLTEMLGMGATIDQNHRMTAALTAALRVILAAQAVAKPPAMQGGWRYTPASRESDLSVSVWQIMALRSAKNNGLEVPDDAIGQAIGFLKRCFSSLINEDGVPIDRAAGFTYTPGMQQPTFAMTAAGMLAMQTCGLYESPVVAAAGRWLLEKPPQPDERYFFYGLYYYAQSLHQLGDEAAEAARKNVARLLLPMQGDDGTWSGQGEERNIGTVYATALAILSLTVRYHYLPIYQR